MRSLPNMIVVAPADEQRSGRSSRHRCSRPPCLRADHAEPHRFSSARTIQFEVVGPWPCARVPTPRFVSTGVQTNPGLRGGGDSSRDRNRGAGAARSHDQTAGRGCSRQRRHVTDTSSHRGTSIVGWLSWSGRRGAQRPLKPRSQLKRLWHSGLGFGEAGPTINCSKKYRPVCRARVAEDVEALLRQRTAANDRPVPSR